MKGLFIRIDKDLDQRLSEVCQREGYKKGGLIARLIREYLDSHGVRDPIKEAEEFGIDTSLLYENLKKSPTERLQKHAQLHAFADSVRGAALRNK